MTRLASALTLGAALALTAATASAQSLEPQVGDLAVRLGVAHIRFDSGADFVVAGQPAPAAGLELSNNTTAALELDYHVHPNVSLSLTVGFPPVTHARGTGQLEPVGRLGSVRFGTGVAQVKYHFGGLGRVQPWVGGGVTRMVVFSERDAAVQDLKVKDHWGGAIQAGAEYMLSPRVGVHGSVSKLFLHTNGTASLGPAPVTARIDLDPTIFQAGLSFRF
jgi:outer membrane protein